MAFYGSVFFVLVLIAFPFLSNGEISEEVAKKIKTVNARGEHYGLVVPGEEELKIVLGPGVFRPYKAMPFVHISARMFHVGNVEGRRTIVVLSGSGSVNAAQTIQLLLTHFRVKAVIHYGRAASANPNYLSIGDVAIPSQFAHIAVWYWEKFGGDDGSYTREIANLTFSNYSAKENVANKLQSIYFQLETVYSVKGKPEEGRAKFWFNANANLLAMAEKIEDVELAQCLHKSGFCLQKQPKIKRVDKGSSADFYVKNVDFRNFVHTQLNVTSLDTESAAIAMVCESENKAFLAMRSVTNYAGGSSEGNDVTVIQQLWESHARTSIQALFKKFAPEDSNLLSVTGVKIW